MSIDFPKPSKTHSRHLGSEKSISQLQKQIALLSQQLSTAENQLDEIRQQNKLLAHEKWQLGQEAAQLIGQLKKIEAISQK